MGQFSRVINIGDWLLAIDQRREDLANWDLRRFWEIVESSGARVTRPTCLFVDGWITLALALKPSDDLGANKRAQQMVEDRERRLKGRQARLDKDNLAAREQWGGEAGTGGLNYRWPVAQRIVSDILSALHKDGQDAKTT